MQYDIIWAITVGKVSTTKIDQSKEGWKWQLKTFSTRLVDIPRLSFFTSISGTTHKNDEDCWFNNLRKLIYNEQKFNKIRNLFI